MKVGTITDFLGGLITVAIVATLVGSTQTARIINAAGGAISRALSSAMGNR